MIRKTLAATKAATFLIEMPGRMHLLTEPAGTGFFVSSDGWMVTAAHVLAKPKGPLEEAAVSKEASAVGGPTRVRGIEIDYIDQDLDLAILRTGLQTGDKPFPFIPISGRPLEEGEPVYSFGYPLSELYRGSPQPHVEVIATKHSPRVTSAIVSSNMEFSEVWPAHGPRPIRYVLDKALNYGNSGGPIVATETGYAHAICSAFQPVWIRQPQLGKLPNGNDILIGIPSNYGVVTSLSNPRFLEELKRRGIPVVQ